MKIFTLFAGIISCASLSLSIDAIDFNTTTMVTASREANAFDCKLPANGLDEWYYGRFNFIVHGCDTDNVTNKPRWPDGNGSNQWAMLNAYMSGGWELTHWRYVKKEDYKDCLKDWTYYAKDGVSVVAHVKGYTTTIGKKKKPWCALAVTQDGGKQGYQWEYCTCTKK